MSDGISDGYREAEEQAERVRHGQEAARAGLARWQNPEKRGWEDWDLGWQLETDRPSHHPEDDSHWCLGTKKSLRDAWKGSPERYPGAWFVQTRRNPVKVVLCASTFGTRTRDVESVVVVWCADGTLIALDERDFFMLAEPADAG